MTASLKWHFVLLLYCLIINISMHQCSCIYVIFFASYIFFLHLISFLNLIYTFLQLIYCPASHISVYIFLYLISFIATIIFVCIWYTFFAFHMFFFVLYIIFASHIFFCISCLFRKTFFHLNIWFYFACFLSRLCFRPF